MNSCHKFQGMNSVNYFEIQSSEPDREIQFYENLFGWKFVRQKDAPIEYYHIETEGIGGGLLKRPTSVPSPGSGTNAFVCTIEVSDFDAMAKKILSIGGQIAMPKFAIRGKCWQGYFMDADQNTFGLFQVDLNAQ